MLNVTHYVLKIALRNRTFLAVYILFGVGFLFSMFLGNTMLTERPQFSVVFFANFCRLLANFGLIAFITINIATLYQNKEIELILSKDITRAGFVINYYFAVVALSLLLVLPLYIFFQVLKVVFNMPISIIGLIIWSLSLFAEIIIIATFTFFISLFVRTSTISILISSFFYLLCRLYGFFLNAINNPESVTNADALTMVMGKILKFIGIFFPRLDLLNQSEWLIYGFHNFSTYSVVLSNCFLSSFLILLLAIFEFKRREI